MGKYLYPVPREDSKRILTFANHDDYISFRHHTYKKAENGKDIELSEVGPRFQLRLYEIKLGTLESSSAADTEWALRPYMNTAKSEDFYPMKMVLKKIFNLLYKLALSTPNQC